MAATPSAPASAAPRADTTPPEGSRLPSEIIVVPGTPGFYTGARRAETLAEYNARLGATANTFGDLGWVLGTKPRA